MKGCLVLMGALCALAVGCGDDQQFVIVNGCELRPGTVCLGADLSGAVLSGTDLSSADLRQANLSNATLRNTNLTGAELTGVNIRGADLTRAILRGARVENVLLNDQTIWSDTICPNGENSNNSPNGTCVPTPRTDGN